MTQPKVLLLSPGYAFSPDGNFGNPHLVSLGSFLETLGAEVTLIDLDYERALPDPQPWRIFDRSFDVVGISAYSSFEYLKSYYIGAEIRRRNPNVVLVAGGYHASARPDDFIKPGSPFDHVVIGDGERPMAQLLEALMRNDRAPQKLGPLPWKELDALPPMNWGLLSRYRGLARARRNQLTLSLSRGCPYRCVFCMEAAKQSRGWRAWSPERVEAELINLSEHFDLRNRTLFLSDAIFGFQPSWRREVIERIRALRLPLRKIWTLARVDTLSQEDVRAMARANISIGFGLESGDPSMLDIIQKGGASLRYLDDVETFVTRANREGLPWGANLIVGHPGETEGSLRRSASWVKRLVEERQPLSGFISVDPYRFYPGSPIDVELDEYEARFGTKIHWPRWWDYSEPQFTASWVSPSRDLSYEARFYLSRSLFFPVVKEVARVFGYRGNAEAYFERSVRSQLRLLGASSQLYSIRYHDLWRGLLGEDPEDPREDPRVQSLNREARKEVVESLAEHLGPLDPRLERALIHTPRERFVSREKLHLAGQDRSIPLNEDSTSTCSAIHAYATNYKFLQLETGDRFLELGGGSGYGAALAAEIVGPKGFVRSVEIEAQLHERAKALINQPQVEFHLGDHQSVSLEGVEKVLFTFALEALPNKYTKHLPMGAVVLAPIAVGDHQELTRFVLEAGGWRRETLGRVRYVQDRSEAKGSTSQKSL